MDFEFVLSPENYRVFCEFARMADVNEAKVAADPYDRIARNSLKGARDTMLNILYKQGVLQKPTVQHELPHLLGAIDTLRLLLYELGWDPGDIMRDAVVIPFFGRPDTKKMRCVQEINRLRVLMYCHRQPQRPDAGARAHDEDMRAHLLFQNRRVDGKRASNTKLRNEVYTARRELQHIVWSSDSQCQRIEAARAALAYNPGEPERFVYPAKSSSLEYKRAYAEYQRQVRKHWVSEKERLRVHLHTLSS